MAGIRLQDVTKSFDNKPVIRGITLDVPDGEFLVLLGPSGCGKSTLLRMIAGLEDVSGGEIHVGERRVDQLPPGARDMAFVFQSYALYPHMTVRQNIAFPLIMRRHRWWFHVPLLGRIAKRGIARSPEVAARVDRAAETLALTPMLDRLPKTLSGGQRQRVALGRAMVREPELFLMDEPLSNLDAKLRTSMRAEIARLHRELGGTFVYVTHDQVEAMTMGSTIVLLKDGAVQQVGSPRAIYAEPENTYVARFIGTPPMNIIEATAADGRIAAGEASLPFMRGAGPVLLGVRPNAMAVTAPGTPGTLEGTVTLVEHVGAETVTNIRLLHARTRHEDEAAADVLVTAPGYGAARIGDRVGVRLDLTEAVLFAPDSGRRLP